MYRTSQCTSTSIDPSITTQSQPTNPFAAIKTINRSELTKGAKVLYSQLRVSAGPKGFVYYRICQLVEHTKSSISSTKAYLQELRSVGLVIPEYRAGRSNKWIVFDPDPTWDGKVPEQGVTPPPPSEDQQGGSRDSDGGGAGESAPLKNVFKNVHKKTLHVPPDPPPVERIPSPENENVTNVDFPDHFQTQRPEPQPDPVPTVNTDVPTITPTPQRASSPDTPEPKTHKVFDAYLLSEILDLTGDTESKGCWISVINQVPEERIRYAMSCLTTAMNEGAVYRPGGYLLTIVMANNPGLTFKGRKYRSTQVSSQEQDQPQTYDSPNAPQPETRRFHEPEPEPEPVEEIDTEALIRGWKIFYNPDRIQSVLFNIRQCLPDWDVTGAWESLKQDRSGQPELEVLNEFLELAALKVKLQYSVSIGAGT